MSAQIKYLARRKGNIPLAARGNAKWRDAILELTLTGNKWEVVGREGGGGGFWGGNVGRWGALMVYARLYPCSVVLPAKKLEMAILSKGKGCS